MRKDARRSSYGGKFVKVFKKFFYSEVHGAMSDRAFRLWIHMLSERPWNENGKKLGDVVVFTRAKAREYGWGRYRFGKARQELLDLKFIEVRDEDQQESITIRPPTRYRMLFDGSQGKALDAKLRSGDIKRPDKRGKMSWTDFNPRPGTEVNPSK